MLWLRVAESISILVCLIVHAMEQAEFQVQTPERCYELGTVSTLRITQQSYMNLPINPINAYSDAINCSVCILPAELTCPLPCDWLVSRNLKATVHHHRLSTFPLRCGLEVRERFVLRAVFDGCSFVCPRLPTVSIDSTLIVGF